MWFILICRWCFVNKIRIICIYNTSEYIIFIFFKTNHTSMYFYMEKNMFHFIILQYNALFDHFFKYVITRELFIFAVTNLHNLMLITNVFSSWPETGTRYMHIINLHDHGNRVRMYNHKGFETSPLQILSDFIDHVILISIFGWSNHIIILSLVYKLCIFYTL